MPGYYVVNLKRGAYVAKDGTSTSVILSKKAAQKVCTERNKAEVSKVRLSKRAIGELEKVSLLLTEANGLIVDLKAKYSPDGEIGFLLQNLENTIGLAQDELSVLEVY